MGQRGGSQRDDRGGLLRRCRYARRFYCLAESPEQRYATRDREYQLRSQSEPEIGAAGNAFIDSLYQQGAAEGISIFVSAGDQGAASSDDDATTATHGIAVSGFASDSLQRGRRRHRISQIAAPSASPGPALSRSEINSSELRVPRFTTFPRFRWNDSCASVVLADHY